MAIAIGIALGGCISNTITLDSEGESATVGDGTTSADPRPPETSGPPPVSTSTTSVGEATSSPPDPTFTDGSEGGDPLGQPCDLPAQDCPTGYKCMPFDRNDSETVWWDDVGCFPVTIGPHQVDQPCHWSDAPWSGFDDCGPAQVCWSPAEAFEGTCKDLCVLGDDGALACSQSSATPLVPCPDCFCVCEVACDPVAQSCPDGQVCLMSGAFGFFQCWPEELGGTGQHADPCGGGLACAPGLMCVAANVVAGCTDPVQCCTSFCDLDGPNTCPGADQGEQCLPLYFDPSMIPVGLEHVGLCGAI